MNFSRRSFYCVIPHVCVCVCFGMKIEAFDSNRNPTFYQIFWFRIELLVINLAMIGVNGSLIALDQMSVILRGAWRRLPASCVHGFTKQSPLFHRDMSHFTHRLSSSSRSLATASILSTQLRYNENSKPIQMYQVRKLSNGDFKSPRVPKRMTHQVLDLHKFEQIVDDTLQSLCERFEEYLEEKADSVLMTTSDVSLSVSARFKSNYLKIASLSQRISFLHFLHNL